MTVSLLSGSTVERFRRREQRYLVRWAGPLLARLEDLAPARRYFVETIYLDRQPARWSAGSPGAKYRIRRYDHGFERWFEVKKRRGEIVLKRRTLLTVDLPQLVEVARVSYRRTAFELPGLRVTIDGGVTSESKLLFSRVVELKGDMVPDFLRNMLPEREKHFSKSKWALGL